MFPRKCFTWWPSFAGTAVFFPLLHGNLIRFILFTAVSFFIYVFVCIFFSLFGQYSECLHLFDISHLMPFFLKVVLLLQCNGKMWNRPNTTCMTNTDWGLRPPTDTDVFYQHPERGSPPSVLYQRIYPPAGSSAEEWGALSGGRGFPKAAAIWNWCACLDTRWNLTECNKHLNSF